MSYPPPILPFIIIILPFLGLFIVWFIGIKISKRLGNIATAIITGVSFLLVCSLYPAIAKGKIINWSIKFALPITVSFRVDALGFFLGFISSLLWFLASVYAIEYMKHEHAQTRYNIFSLLSFCGMMGIVFTGNLLSLYIFFELMAILSYMLVIHEETPEAMRAGLKYLFMGIVGGLLLLFAILATYVITGTLTLKAAGLAGLKESSYFAFIFWAFIIGFGVKAGIFPVHVWLPDAHPVAPSPASALLSGVMIKAGAYGIIRTIYAIYGASLLASVSSSKLVIVIALITMILGSGVALLQKEIKRLLAYSSIAQIGYVVLGASMLSSTGLTGGIFHILSHALTKGTLFLCAGAFIHQTGKREISELKGIGHRMPITMICFTIAACSMVGFPPLSGFISKWLLAQGALQAAENGIFSLNWGLVILSALLLSSLLNAMYYGPIVIRAWFKEGSHSSHSSHSNPHRKEEKVEKKDPTWEMLIPVIILSLFILAFGLYPKHPLLLARKVTQIYLGVGVK
jgi:multicomponent Na+:H+ antiporter subunit D